VLLLDATRGLEVQDLKIANLVLEEGRALMIAINKWDVAEDASALFNGVRAALEEGLAQLKGVPLLSVSARTGKGLDQLLGAAFELREQWSRRVPTAALNRWFEHCARDQPAARARRQAHQAALRHPDQDAAAELRGVRQPARRPARELRALPDQRAAARARVRRSAGAAYAAQLEEPVREGVTRQGRLSARPRARRFGRIVLIARTSRTSG
jgi:Fe2+ transport system protein B